MTIKTDPITYPPRGLSRDEAARYVGISATKFDKLVDDKRMPRPRRIDGRLVWDRLQLEAAFNDLPETGESRLDKLVEGRRILGLGEN